MPAFVMRLKASVFFLSTKIRVKGSCREIYKLVYTAKYLPNTQTYAATFHLTKILLVGSSFLSNSVLFFHVVQIGEKDHALVTAISLLHGKDYRAALSEESMVLLLQIGLA